MPIKKVICDLKREMKLISNRNFNLQLLFCSGIVGFKKDTFITKVNKYYFK